MTIGGLDAYSPYQYLQAGGFGGAAGGHGAASVSGGAVAPEVSGVRNVEGGAGAGRAADEDSIKKAGRKSSPEECQTCKDRKYQDGSDENVSFKAASHISPESAGTMVRAHEQEHVSNAYAKAAKDNGKVLSASVSIHTAVCPECGRTYVSGGTTNTMIKYSNEENPYQKSRKLQDSLRLRGRNIDYVA